MRVEGEHVGGGGRCGWRGKMMMVREDKGGGGRGGGGGTGVYHHG